MAIYKTISKEYGEEKVLSNKLENAALAHANKHNHVGLLRVSVFDILQEQWLDFNVTIEPVGTVLEDPERIVPSTIRLKNPEPHKNSYRGKRIGIFSLPESMIWQMPATVKLIMGKMIILYAQWNPDQTAITYMAICDDFDEVMVSDENPMDYSAIPGYGILVEKNGFRITREK